MEERIKYACLFGGGAIRGLAHVGVIRALNKLNIEIGTLAGSSVGSIVATLLALGYSANEIEEIFLFVNFELFRDINWGKSVALSKGDLFREWMRKLIAQKFYGDDFANKPPVTFADLEKDLIIIATDLTNFKSKEFSKFTTPDFEIAEAVRISSCMPGLMSAVDVENAVLVDGDLQKSWPMWELAQTLKNTDENVLEIRLEGSTCSNLANPICYINTVYSCITSIASEFISKIYAHDERHDVFCLNTGDVVVVNFQMKLDERKALVKAGFDQTMKYFCEILPKKKMKTIDNYVKLRNYVVDIRKLVLEDKVLEAQAKYAGMTKLLAENNHVIDEKICAEILSVAGELLDNTAKTIFLRKVYLKNHRSLLKILDNLENNLSMRKKNSQKFLEKIEKY